MDSSPPSQPPWHARALTYTLVFISKHGGRFLLNFLMLHFYPCHNSPQVSLSSLTHSSSCSDIKGGHVQQLLQVNCKQILREVPSIKTHANGRRKPPSRESRALGAQKKNVFVLEKQMHRPFQITIKHMETITWNCFYFASTKPQKNHISWRYMPYTPNQLNFLFWLLRRC